MTLSEFIYLLVSGRVLVWLLQNNHALKRSIDSAGGVIGAELRYLYNCDLCLGFWVYTFLLFFGRIRVSPLRSWSRIVESVASGGLLTTVMFVFGVGAKFVLNVQEEWNAE